jgi:hypothetical protein
MSDPNIFDLADSLLRGSTVQLLSARLAPDLGSPFAIITYSLNGEEQSRGLRFDMGKRAFLDLIGRPEADKELSQLSLELAQALAKRATVSPPRRSQDAPRVFISYTHESPDHKSWVAALATDLRRNGIDAILDQWELTYGADVTLYMEQGIQSASRVLLICTPTYARKANEGAGGVGYERLVVTGEMALNIETTKFICLLREGEPSSALPTFARTRVYVDFRDDVRYRSSLESLLRDILRAPANPKPPLGENPFSRPPIESSADSDSDPSGENGPLTAVEVLDQAEAALTATNRIPWRRLVTRVRGLVGPALVQWRAGAEKKSLRSEDDLIPLMHEAVDRCSPLMALALAAAESGVQDVSDQRALIDDFLNVPNWNGSGLTVLVEAPSTMAFSYHYLLGATLASMGRRTDCIALLMSKVADRNTGEVSELWANHRLMGWPQSLGHNSDRGWSFLLSLYHQHIWLQRLYSSHSSFADSIRIYALTASLLELCQYVRAGGTADTAKQGVRFSVPPMFALGESHGDNLGRILRKTLPDARATEEIAEQYRLPADQLRAAWPGWVAAYVFWHSRASRPFFNLRFDKGWETLP